MSGTENFTADELKALTGDKPEAQPQSEPVVEAKPETPEKPQAEVEKPRDETGKFVASKPEAEEADAAEPAKKGDVSKALKQEREARKQAEQQLAEQRRQDAVERGRMEERLNLLAQVVAKPADQPKERDPNEVLAQHDALLTNMLRERDQNAARVQFAHIVSSQVNEFKAQKPDYDAAYAHLVSNRQAELQAMGVNPSQIPAILAKDEFEVAAMALQAGRNPAEAVYALALQRGYAAKADVKPMTVQSDAEKAKTIAKGQAAATSLGSAGGVAPATGLDLKRLATMTDAEFAEATKDPDKLRAAFAAHR